MRERVRESERESERVREDVSGRECERVETFWWRGAPVSLISFKRCA